MKQLILAVSLMTVAASSGAAEYLGLDLGVASKDKIVQQLKASNSPFDDSYGYKGYVDLSTIKVLGYEKFSKLGKVNNAWLHFSPKQVLYRISVTYNDAGDTFKVLKDALDTKYGRPRQEGAGFNREYLYRDGNVGISLLRNTFGFDSNQLTTLTYDWTPFAGEVGKMKATIDEDIRRKNAAKAGKDL
ncbi:MAG: hypothetical protein K9K30_08240 [Burkholderiaceae bacterium]|nr:hypothetical protein [Sulfuritalea sp.]MCF8175213.1 hypothetical protein [Burkholderiaceae bacterium]